MRNPAHHQTLDLGDLRRLEPMDDAFGTGRGKPIDRHYIEGFLEQHADDIHGRVLEVADSTYTRRFGGGRVTAAEVLHRDPTHPGVTWAADLADCETLPSGRFDAFICTQTLQYVFPLARAVATMHRILKPGGVLLLTVPGISQISPVDRDRFGEHWRFAPQALERLLGEAFGAANVQVRSHGNVLAAIGFLHGLACEDLSVAELDHADERYPLLLTARAVRSTA